MLTYKDILSNVQTGIKEAKISAPEAIAKAVVGIEDSSIDSAYVKESTAVLTSVVEEALSGVPGLEESQITAAKYGALMDQDTIGVIKQKRSMPAVEGDSTIVGAGIFGESDVYDTPLVATEEFDGQIVANNTPFSFGVNLVTSKQDEFTETIYPTVVLKPGTSGCAITTQVERIENGFLRSDSGPDRLKKNSVSLVKALIDENSILNGEKTRLVPVSNVANNDVLLPAFQYGTDVTGDAITTAPLKVNLDIPIIGISQTSAQLAEGVRDNTDSLDDTVVLERLYYKLDDGTDTSDHYFDVSGFSSARWTPSAAGSNKDILLNFISDAISINTTTTKQVDGSDSDVLTNLAAANHTIQVRAVVYGNGNVSIGDVSVSPGKFELVGIKKPDGTYVPTTDALYATVKGIVEGIEMLGYTLETYMTNSNLRNIGYILSTVTATTIYSVGYRTPISVLKPQIHSADTDNDANKIKSFGNQARAMSTVLGVSKLVKYAGFLRTSAANGADLTLTELAGVAKDMINPYYTNKAIDLETTVDSMNSMDLKANMKGSIVATLSNAVNEMLYATGYLDAFENTQNVIGSKPTIIVATDRKIKNILTTGEPISFGDAVNVKIVATGSRAFANKIMLMPTTGSKEVNALNFGLRAFVPTPTVEIRRSINGTSINALYTQPCFEFINLLPILAEFDVSGFEAITAKITQNTHNA